MPLEPEVAAPAPLATPTPAPPPGTAYPCASQQGHKLGPLRCDSPDGSIHVTLYRALAWVDLGARSEDGSVSNPSKLTFGGQEATFTIPDTPDNGSLAGMTFIVMRDDKGLFTVYAKNEPRSADEVQAA